VLGRGASPRLTGLAAGSHLLTARVLGTMRQVPLRVFADLLALSRKAQRALRRGSFRTTRELVRRIDVFVQHSNPGARPFAWTTTAEPTLAKLQRPRRAIVDRRAPSAPAPLRAQPPGRERSGGASLTFAEAAR
jgi:hypothetical protein